MDSFTKPCQLTYHCETLARRRYEPYEEGDYYRYLRHGSSYLGDDVKVSRLIVNTAHDNGNSGWEGTVLKASQQTTVAEFRHP
jgi:hypothetical protein